MNSNKNSQDSYESSPETIHWGNSSDPHRAMRELRPGVFLGKFRNFRLEKYLNKGGMGQVWLASELQGETLLRQVVCKIVPMAVQKDSREMQNIVRVFQLTKDLNHTNICPLYGMYEDPDYGWFFVMGYADGGTLYDWFCRHPDSQKGLPLSEVQPILMDLANALDYAHKNAVIHRDIKPQNVMFRNLKESRITWLLDFGLAAQIHESQSVTQNARSSSGTPSYMAPEQCQGELQDARTDQYSLAVLAYLLLGGELPFRGVDILLMYQIISKRPADLPNVPPHVNAALQKALSKDKNDRFATCTEFMEALTGGKVVNSQCTSKVKKEKKPTETVVKGSLTGRILKEIILLTLYGLPVGTLACRIGGWYYAGFRDSLGLFFLLPAIAFYMTIVMATIFYLCERTNPLKTYYGLKEAVTVVTLTIVGLLCGICPRVIPYYHSYDLGWSIFVGEFLGCGIGLIFAFLHHRKIIQIRCPENRKSFLISAGILYAVIMTIYIGIALILHIFHILEIS